MKIEKIKINSYGTLKNKEINLKNNLNIIYGKNESGKSTLLNFIKNIFYGISKNKNGKEISDYEKYLPWESENFSGKIEYELNNGNKFEIFRDFNKKNPQLIDENSEEILSKFKIDKKDGSQFFYEQTGVDEKMYISTIMTPQQEVVLNSASKNNLLQKVANLGGTGDGDVSFSKVIDSINKRQIEEVGGQRTQDRPINLLQNRNKELEVVLKDEKMLFEKKQNLQSKKEDFLKKLEEEKQNYEIIKNKNQLLYNEQIEKEKNNIKNKLEKENKYKNKKIILILILFFLIIVNIFNFIFIPNKIINYIILLLIPINIILLILNLKNKNKIKNNFINKNLENKTNNISNNENLEEEKKQIEQKLEKINQKILDYELQLNEIKYEENEISEEIEKITSYKEEQANIKEKLEILEQKNICFQEAKHLLEKAYEKMKNNVTPKFTQNLSAIIKEISNGKYEKISINDEIVVELENGRTVSANNLSIGTIDEIYLALRLSMLDEISKEKMPVILDETFAYFDEERLKNILLFLHKQSENHQIILLTCTNREKQILNELNIDYNFIEL